MNIDNNRDHNNVDQPIQPPKNTTTEYIANVAQGTLLIHSRTKKILTEDQVLALFKRFILYYDANLTNVTSMTLGAGLTTAIFCDCKSDQLFRGKSHSICFEHVSSVLKTSVERMRSTYIDVDCLEFEKSANPMMKGMETVLTIANCCNQRIGDGGMTYDFITEQYKSDKCRPRHVLSKHYGFLDM